MATDWQGKECAPLGEGESAPHWTMEPHPNPQYDTMVVRGWQDFIDMAKDGVESVLDGISEDEARAGVTFTFRLVDCSLDDF